MKTDRSLTDVYFPRLSEQEEARLMGGGGVPPSGDNVILDEETPL